LFITSFSGSTAYEDVDRPGSLSSC